MANKIIISALGFSATPADPQTITVKYKKSAEPDANYQVAAAGLVVPISGILSAPLEITPVDLNTNYTVSFTNQCNGKTLYKEVRIDQPITYLWVEDTYVCETDNGLSVVAEITGLSSPRSLYYYAAKNRMYVTDLDSTSGNVWWFNPATFASAADAVYYPGIKKVVYDSAVAIDTTRKKIYMAGRDTGGLIVFNMELDQLEKVIAYGQDTEYSRLLVTLQGDTIYCSNRIGTNTLTLINANTLEITTTRTIGSIPSGTSYLSDGYSITDVGSELWVAPQAGRLAGGIAVYDKSLNTLITTKDDGMLSWDSSKYWCNSFFDQEKNRYYLSDIGSSKIFIYDTTTRALLKTIHFQNREGKTNVGASFKIDENTQKLYVIYRAYNSISEPNIENIYRTYIFNRDTLEFEVMLPGAKLGEITFQTGSKYAWGCNGGQTVWIGGAWATDGTVTKLSY